MKKLQVLLPAMALLAATIPAGNAQRINAAGATFPAAIYQKWFDEYHKLHANVEVNYQSIGSGGGIAQLTAGTVDFGASDMPMTDQQISKLTVKPLHFPSVLGAVVPSYNIPGVTAELKFTPETLAGIYLAKITKWNDPQLAKDNPGVKLPNEDIVVVHRAEGSGTTFVWTDYLSKISPEWKSKVGANSSVSWPVGLGGRGNEGVAGLLKQTANSIGYVELVWAMQNKLTVGVVKNSAGAFVNASVESVTEAAATTAKAMPEDFRISITNAPGKKAFPISSFTYLLVPSKIADVGKANTIKEFLKWMLADGQKFAPALYYAPLPTQVVAKEVKQIAQINAPVEQSKKK
ncbi:MAG: phosphate ABC transporter substrate-binding protein PstS [Bryobacteraceae bacterium]